VIGGMAKEKQVRIIENRPHILITTAGRLWDLIETDNLLYLRSLAMIRFLVLDEADRMIELG
jgi:superfamily II DNA/RNA helicase